MDKILLKYGHFVLDIKSLLLLILIIGFSIILTRFIKKKEFSFLSKSAKLIDISILWLLSIFLILFLIFPAHSKLVIYESKIIIISFIGIWVLVFILFLNLFIIRQLKTWYTNLGLSEEKSSFALLKFIFWLLSIHFIFKLFLKTYQAAVEIVIIKTKVFQLTIYDILFLLISLAITVVIIVFLRIGFNRLVKSQKIDRPTAITFLSISKYFIWTITIIIILQSIGLNLSVVLAGSAALLVGVGLGIQQVFNDFVSGIILLFEREIKVGDYVEADTVSGTILNIGFRTTLMLTRDNIRIIIPNSKLVSNKVINWTKGEAFARVGIDVGVAYGSDTYKVKEVLLRSAKDHESIMRKPIPEVYFLDFAGSSLNFRLYFYTEKVFYREKIKSDLRYIIYDEFNKEGIQIPFQQIDIHLPNAPDK